MTTLHGEPLQGLAEYLAGADEELEEAKQTEGLDLNENVINYINNSTQDYTVPPLLATLFESPPALSAKLLLQIGKKVKKIVNQEGKRLGKQKKKRASKLDPVKVRAEETDVQTEGDIDVGREVEKIQAEEGEKENMKDQPQDGSVPMQEEHVQQAVATVIEPDSVAESRIEDEEEVDRNQLNLLNSELLAAWEQSLPIDEPTPVSSVPAQIVDKPTKKRKLEVDQKTKGSKKPKLQRPTTISDRADKTKISKPAKLLAKDSNPDFYNAIVNASPKKDHLKVKIKRGKCGYQVEQKPVSAKNRAIHCLSKMKGVGRIPKKKPDVVSSPPSQPSTVAEMWQKARQMSKNWDLIKKNKFGRTSKTESSKPAKRVSQSSPKKEHKHRRASTHNQPVECKADFREKDYRNHEFEYAPPPPKPKPEPNTKLNGKLRGAQERLQSHTFHPRVFRLVIPNIDEQKGDYKELFKLETVKANKVRRQFRLPHQKKAEDRVNPRFGNRVPLKQFIVPKDFRMPPESKRFDPDDRVRDRSDRIMRKYRNMCNDVDALENAARKAVSDNALVCMLNILDVYTSGRINKPWGDEPAPQAMTMRRRVLETRLQSAKRSTPFAFYLQMLDKIREAKLPLAKTIRLVHGFECRRTVADLPVYFPLPAPPPMDEYGRTIAPKNIVNYSPDMPAYHEVYDKNRDSEEARNYFSQKYERLGVRQQTGNMAPPPPHPYRQQGPARFQNTYRAWPRQY